MIRKHLSFLFASSIFESLEYLLLTGGFFTLFNDPELNMELKTYLAGCLLLEDGVRLSPATHTEGVLLRLHIPS